MSQLDNNTLNGMGVHLTGRRLRVPMYMKERYETILFRGVSITRRVDRDYSLQELSALILQIQDINKFRRYYPDRVWNKIENTEGYNIISNRILWLNLG